MGKSAARTTESEKGENNQQQMRTATGTSKREIVGFAEHGAQSEGPRMQLFPSEIFCGCEPSPVRARPMPHAAFAAALRFQVLPDFRLPARTL